jgi:hypothetical protein
MAIVHFENDSLFLTFDELALSQSPLFHAAAGLTPRRRLLMYADLKGVPPDDLYTLTMNAASESAA